jgi:hypothetical protein
MLTNAQSETTASSQQHSRQAVESALQQREWVRPWQASGAGRCLLRLGMRILAALGMPQRIQTITIAGTTKNVLQYRWIAGCPNHTAPGVFWASIFF